MLLENRHVCLVKKTPTKLPKLKRNKVLNTWDRANIRKIIPTGPRVSHPGFHQTALQDLIGQCGPEEPFGETKVDSLLAAEELFS